MSLISNGINSVRAFSLPAGIRPDGDSVDTPRIVLVQWRSVLQDVYYQVYVNGVFAGTTLDTSQRRMVVPIPSAFDYPVRIEVFAVKAEDADKDLSYELTNPASRSGKVKIKMLRGHDLPIDAAAQIYFDNGTGTIDYDSPLAETPINIWPSWQDKAGFGMSRFGLGDFGYDCAAAVGFGKGCFGLGGFGMDADFIEWTSPPLEAGVYKFAVVICDSAGGKSLAAETGPITVTPPAKPAESLEIYSFDQQTNEMVFEIE